MHSYESQVFCWSVVILLFFQIRQEKPPPPGEMSKDTQVTIVGATMPDELIVDTLQDMLPVRCNFLYIRTVSFSIGIYQSFTQVKRQGIKKYWDPV